MTILYGNVGGNVSQYSSSSILIGDWWLPGRILTLCLFLPCKSKSVQDTRAQGTHFHGSFFPPEPPGGLNEVATVLRVLCHCSLDFSEESIKKTKIIIRDMA